MRLKDLVMQTTYEKIEPALKKSMIQKDWYTMTRKK